MAPTAEKAQQAESAQQMQWRATSRYVHVLLTADGREVGHVSRWTGGQWLGYVDGVRGHVALAALDEARRAVEQRAGEMNGQQ